MIKIVSICLPHIKFGQVSGRELDLTMLIITFSIPPIFLPSTIPTLFPSKLQRFSSRETKTRKSMPCPTQRALASHHPHSNSPPYEQTTHIYIPLTHPSPFPVLAFTPPRYGTLLHTSSSSLVGSDLKI